MVKFKINFIDLKTGGSSFLSTNTSSTSNSDYFVCFAILVDMNIENKSVLTEREEIDKPLHKSIFSIKTDKQKFDLAKNDLIEFLQSRKKIYQAIFPNISTHYKIEGSNYMQLLDESFKIYYDAMSTDLLNFLIEKNLITQGTEESISPQLKKLEDGPEKEAKNELFLKYGSAQAPPSMSHHLTLYYNLDENLENNIFKNTNDEEIKINYAGIVISEINRAGQLIGEPIYLDEKPNQRVIKPLFSYKISEYQQRIKDQQDLTSPNLLSIEQLENKINDELNVFKNEDFKNYLKMTLDIIIKIIKNEKTKIRTIDNKLNVKDKFKELAFFNILSKHLENKEYYKLQEYYVPAIKNILELLHKIYQKKNVKLTFEEFVINVLNLTDEGLESYEIRQDNTLLGFIKGIVNAKVYYTFTLDDNYSKLKNVHSEVDLEGF